MTTRYDIERALETSGLPPHTRHIVLVLCTRMDQGSTSIPAPYSPSLSRLSRMTGLDRRTVMRHLNLAEREGWVARARPSRHLARTQHRTTAYSVMIPERFPQVSGLGARIPGTRDKTTPGLGAQSPEARDTVPHRTEHPEPSQEAELDLVITELQKRTGRMVSRDWAMRVREQLLAEPGVRRPPGYIAHRIRTDPDPSKFLPTAQPPRFSAADERRRHEEREN